MAVFELPLLLIRSASSPIAVFQLPVMLPLSASLPKPLLPPPVVRLTRTPVPSAVLPLGSTPPRSEAATLGESAKQVTTSRIVPNVMFNLFIVNSPFVVLGLPWLPFMGLSLLAVHRCTAYNFAVRYAENAENRELTRMPQMRSDDKKIRRKLRCASAIQIVCPC